MTNPSDSDVPTQTVEWFWMDFEYISGKSKMDSRRAAFLLFDFINRYSIEQFQVIQTDGEWQNARITAVYQMPKGWDEDKLEEDWADFIENWKEKH